MEPTLKKEPDPDPTIEKLGYKSQYRSRQDGGSGWRMELTQNRIRPIRKTRSTATSIYIVLRIRGKNLCIKILFVLSSNFKSYP